VVRDFHHRDSIADVGDLIWRKTDVLLEECLHPGTRLGGGARADCNDQNDQEKRTQHGSH
jgi:hypothetical protein